MTLDVLIRPEFKADKNSRLNIAFIASTTKKTYSLPAKLQLLLSKLKNLPCEFGGQSIGVKTQIMGTVSEAREVIRFMQDEIEMLKSDALGVMARKRAKPIIRAKKNHIAVLCQTLGRFHV
jgi:hypothetical protein